MIKKCTSDNSKLIWTTDVFSTWAFAEVGNTRMWVQLASLGVESWQLLAVWPNLSSGVYWSVIRRRFESGSIDTRQADRIEGTSLCQQHISRKSFEARFKALRLRRTLQPKRTNEKILSMIKNLKNICRWNILFLMKMWIKWRTKIEIAISYKTKCQN